MYSLEKTLKESEGFLFSGQNLFDKSDKISFSVSVSQWYIVALVVSLCIFDIGVNKVFHVDIIYMKSIQIKSYINY